MFRKNTLFFAIFFLIQTTHCKLLTGSGEKEDNSAILLFLGGATQVGNSGGIDLSPGKPVDLSGDGGSDGTLVDSNNDGISDGIDLTGDGIVNILLLDTNGDSLPDAIDINGDGQPDYFLNPNAPPLLTTGFGGTGEPVVLIIDSSGEIIGFDTDGDGIANDTSIATILNDTILPIISMSPNGGTFASGQTVTFTCLDNKSTGSILFTTNGTVPSYPTTGNLIINSSGSVELSTDGNYEVRAICRDLAGNVSNPMLLRNFQIDSNVPNVSIENLSSVYVSSSGSAINSATISWRTNRSGEFTIRESAGNCNSGTIVTGPATVTANSIQEFERTAGSHFSGEGTKTYRICVKTNTDLEGYTTFNLTRDDTAPIVTPSVGSGNFGVATSVSLSCSDTGGSGCKTIVYNTQTGSPPGNPTINGSTGIVGVGTIYSNVPINMTDGAKTYIKYIARDLAGNVASVTSQDYTVDTQVATITVNSYSD